MARAIFIDPVSKQVTISAAPKTKRDLQLVFGGKIFAALTLPNGDRIYVGKGTVQTGTFTLGGSAPLQGIAVVLGRFDPLGYSIGTRTPLSAIAHMTKFRI